MDCWVLNLVQKQKWNRKMDCILPVSSSQQLSERSSRLLFYKASLSHVCFIMPLSRSSACHYYMSFGSYLGVLFFCLIGSSDSSRVWVKPSSPSPVSEIPMHSFKSTASIFVALQYPTCQRWSEMHSFFQSLNKTLESFWTQSPRGPHW